MAIIIPSKNIYEINNQKVVDNEVDNIELGAKKISQSTRYNTEVYSEVISSFSNLEDESNFEAKSSREISSVLDTSAAYVRVDKARFVDEKQILIPVKSGNSRTTNLRLGTSGGVANIKSLVYCKYESGTASASWRLVYNLVNWSYGSIQPNQVEIYLKKWGDTRDEYIEYDRIGTQIEGQQIYIPEDKKVSYSVAETNLVEETTAELSPQIFQKTNLAQIRNAETVTIDGKEYYKISVSIASGYRVVKLGGKNEYTITGDMIDQRNWEEQITMNGTYEWYLPQSIELTINGDVLTIDLEDETVKIGSGKHIYSFNGNELIQTTNSPSPESIYSNIINNWENGKETAILRCSIDNYYNDDKTQAILKNDNFYPMTLRIGDIVCPYIMNAKGIDVPMSLYKDGNPKEFLVIGKNIIYDGAPQQEITIQEIYQTE